MLLISQNESNELFKKTSVESLTMPTRWIPDVCICEILPEPIKLKLKGSATS